MDLVSGRCANHVISDVCGWHNCRQSGARLSPAECSRRGGVETLEFRIPDAGARFAFRENGAGGDVQLGE